jgi:hypothetical protein
MFEVTPLESGLVAVGWITSVAFAFKFGRRAERKADKLKAKIAVAAVIDRITSEVAKHPRVSDLFFGTRDELRTAVSKLSCQAAKRRRHKMTTALTKFYTLDIKGRSNVARYSGGNGEVQDGDRRLMLDGLMALKDEISAA